MRDRHRLLLVVGDDDEGGAEPLLQLHQLELRLVAQLLVERGERLVEQQHLRPLGERARERDALALAAGELVRLAVLAGRSSWTSASISATRAAISARASRSASGRTRCCRRR